MSVYVATMYGTKRDDVWNVGLARVGDDWAGTFVVCLHPKGSEAFETAARADADLPFRRDREVLSKEEFLNALPDYSHLVVTREDEFRILSGSLPNVLLRPQYQIPDWQFHDNTILGSDRDDLEYYAYQLARRMRKSSCAWCPRLSDSCEASIAASLNRYGDVERLPLPESIREGVRSEFLEEHVPRRLRYWSSLTRKLLRRFRDGPSSRDVVDFVCVDPREPMRRLENLSTSEIRLRMLVYFNKSDAGSRSIRFYLFVNFAPHFYMLWRAMDDFETEFELTVDESATTVSECTVDGFVVPALFDDQMKRPRRNEAQAAVVEFEMRSCGGRWIFSDGVLKSIVFVSDVLDD